MLGLGVARVAPAVRGTDRTRPPRIAPGFRVSPRTSPAPRARRG